jgi:hypothetical protein
MQRLTPLYVIRTDLVQAKRKKGVASVDEIYSTKHCFQNIIVNLNTIVWICWLKLEKHKRLFHTSQKTKNSLFKKVRSATEFQKSYRSLFWQLTNQNINLVSYSELRNVGKVAENAA